MNPLSELNGLTIIEVSPGRVTLEDGTMLTVSAAKFAEDVLPTPRCHSCAAKSVCARLAGRFEMTPHNMVAHPLMEILALVGLKRWALKVHNAILPAVAKEALAANKWTVLSQKA